MEPVGSNLWLERWLRERRQTEPRALYMTLEDLLLDDDARPAGERYPETLDVGGVPFPLAYRYAPGEPDDGITLTVPLEALAQVDGVRLGWLVPGWLPEKVVGLLRGLPKARRRLLAPLADTANAICDDLPFGQGSLEEALSARLEALGHARVPVTAWDSNRLPVVLSIRVAVRDRENRIIDADRDLPALRARLLATREADRAVEVTVETRSGLRDWPEEPLPERVAASRRGYVVSRYPALRDDGDSVSVTLCDTPEEAARVQRGGVRRLVATALGRELRRVVARIRDLDRLAMVHGTLGDPVPFERALMDRIVDVAAGLDQAPIRSRDAFDAAVGRARAGVERTAVALVPQVRDVLERYHDLAGKLSVDAPPPYRPSVSDLIAQLGLLLGPDFLRTTPSEWFEQMPRYLEAMQVRLRKLGEGGLAKDRRNMEAVDRHWRRYASRHAELERQGLVSDALERYRWWIEELRVSLFAQELGTHVPISAKRLDAQWDQAVFG